MIEQQPSILDKAARDIERVRVVKEVAELNKQIMELGFKRNKLIDDFGRCNKYIRDVGPSWIGCRRIEGHEGRCQEKV